MSASIDGGHGQWGGELTRDWRELKARRLLRGGWYWRAEVRWGARVGSNEEKFSPSMAKSNVCANGL